MPEMSLKRVKMHLMLVGSAVTTAHHLLVVHELPEDLIDVEDITGMDVDHAYLHGYGVDVNGRFYPLAEGT